MIVTWVALNNPSCNSYFMGNIPLPRENYMECNWGH